MTDITVTGLENQSPFDSIRHSDEGGKEFWSARELMILLGYARWNEFAKVVKRSSISCGNSGNSIAEHFSGTTRRIESKAGRAGEDWKLSRFACYLIAQNGDPEKPEIAAAQSYFAIKTREAETRVVPSEQLQLARLENENIKLKMLVMDLHGVELGLTILGKEGRIVEVEKVSTEIVQPLTGRSDKILTADQLKSEVARKTGQKLKSMKQFTDQLRAKGRDDLLVPVTRHSTSEYIDPDQLNEAIAVVFGEERQAVLKPVISQPVLAENRPRQTLPRLRHPS
jgi:BRO family, N-terminal domain